MLEVCVPIAVVGTQLIQLHNIAWHPCKACYIMSYYCWYITCDLRSERIVSSLVHSSELFPTHGPAFGLVPAGSWEPESTHGKWGPTSQWSVWQDCISLRAPAMLRVSSYVFWNSLNISFSHIHFRKSHSKRVRCITQPPLVRICVRLAGSASDAVAGSTASTDRPACISPVERVTSIFFGGHKDGSLVVFDGVGIMWRYTGRDFWAVVCTCISTHVCQLYHLYRHWVSRGILLKVSVFDSIMWSFHVESDACGYIQYRDQCRIVWIYSGTRHRPLFSFLAYIVFGLLCTQRHTQSHEITHTHTHMKVSWNLTIQW